MRRLGVAMVAAGAVALLGARGARAADYCVSAPDCAGTPAANLKAAVDAANAAGAGPHTIRIGPGTFPYPGEAYGTKPITVIGAGRGATVLSGGGAGAKVLTLFDPASEVRDLTVRLSSADSQTAVHLYGGVARRVDVDGTGGSVSTGFLLTRGADAEDVTASLSTTAPGANYGIDVSRDVGFPGATTITGADLTARYGLYVFTPDEVTIRRVRTAGDIYGLFVRDAGDVDADGLLARALPGGVAVGVESYGDTLPTHVDLRHATIVGAPDETALVIAQDNPLTSDVVARDTVITGGSPADVELATYGAGATARLDIAYSAFRPTTVVASGPGAEEVVSGAGIVTPAAPGFADAAGLDFRLVAGSPLIDAGEPGALAAGQSTVDLAGLARLVDGNGDGEARRDIGAYEYQPPPPPTGGGTTPTTARPPAAPPPIAEPRPLLTLPGGRIRVTRTYVARLPIRCSGAPCDGTLRLSTVIRRNGRAKRITIGRGAFSLATGRTATVRIRLTRDGRALLRRGRVLRATLRAAMVTGTVSRNLTLLAPKKPR